MGKSPVIRGEPISNEVAELIAELNEYLKPENSLERIANYAKWIFGLGVTIGAIGVGLNAFTGPMPRNAAIAFAVSVLFFALSLVFSVFALQPSRVELRVADAETIQKVNTLVRRKQGALSIATASLVISLVAAGLTPLLRAAQKQVPAKPPVYGVGVIVRDDSVFVTLKGYRFADSSLAAVRIGGLTTQLLFASVPADTLGQVTVQVNAKRPNTRNDVRLTGGMFHSRRHQFTDSTAIVLWPTIPSPPATR